MRFATGMLWVLGALVGGVSTSPATERCVLSVVMVGRNDEWQSGGNYGNFSTRLVNSISSFILHAERLALPLQVVVVDYNPPDDAPSLERQYFEQAAGIPPAAWRYSELVFVTVPTAVHAQIQSLPPWRQYSARLLEYVAKNSGLRFARCEFALVTNPDIVPGAAVMKFFADTLVGAPGTDGHYVAFASALWWEGKFATLSRTNARHAVPLEALANGDVDRLERLLASGSGAPVAGELPLLPKVLPACADAPFQRSARRLFAGVTPGVASAWRLSRNREQRGHRRHRKQNHEPHAPSHDRGRICWPWYAGMGAGERGARCSRGRTHTASLVTGHLSPAAPGRQGARCAREEGARCRQQRPRHRRGPLSHDGCDSGPACVDALLRRAGVGCW